MEQDVSSISEVYVDRIATLAEEIESSDPIDWGLLQISEDNAYKLIAANVINQFNKYSMDEREIMIATITKLVVENFVLNLKLQRD